MIRNTFYVKLKYFESQKFVDDLNKSDNRLLQKL